MRRFLALPLVLVVACAAPSSEVEEEGSSASNMTKNESVAWGDCAYTREEILSTVSAARRAVIARGFEWLDADVPFSSSARYEGYRTDCSGFVSMCYELGAPGKTTRDFGKAGSGTSRLSSYDDLVPADALVNAGHHSVIFLGWNDAAKKGACVLEQSSTKNDMQFRVRLTSTLKNDGFVPVRSDDLANDTAYSAPKGKKEEASATACVPPSLRDICQQATKDKGLECGRADDGCGGTVDCSELSTYACASGETCRANKCVTTTTPAPTTPKPPTPRPTPTTPAPTTPKPPTTCIPKSTETLCREARVSQYVECGPISDGCGGIVSCDEVPSFGCATNPGTTCRANTCMPSSCTPKPTATLCAEAAAKNGAECGWIADGCGGTVSCDKVEGFGCASGETCGRETNRCAATQPSSTGIQTGDVDTSADTSGPAADEDQGEENDPEMPRREKRTPSTTAGGCSATPSTNLGNAPLALAMMAVGGLLRRRARRARTTA